MKKFRDMFSNKNYSKLLVASLASQMGSYIGSTAFLFYLLKEFTTKPYLATLTELMNTLPVLLVFLFIGVIADKFDRQMVVKYSDLFSAGLSLLLIVGVLIESIPFMFAILFIRFMVQSFFAPAESGIIQGILTKDEYLLSSGFNSMIQSLFVLFGRGFGVLVYWLVGIQGAILMDALSFFISYLLVRSCSIPEEVRLPNGKHSWKDVHFKKIFTDFHKGVKYVYDHNFLKFIVSGYFLFGIINASYALMPIYFLKYNLSPESYEKLAIWEGIAMGGGILLGSFAISFVTDKYKPIQLIASGLLLSGFFTACTGFSSNVLFFLTFTFLASFFLPFINVAMGGLLPMIVDASFMGRVKGVIQPLSMLGSVITVLILTVIFPGYISIDKLYLFVGGMMVGMGILYNILLPKHEPKEE